MSAGDSFDTPGVRQTIAALEAAGGAARLVGGVVRDRLLGHPTSDVDIATTLTPDRTLAALSDAGLRSAETGIDHGTVTAITPHGAFEVTSLRRDVATDGRRATVAFTADWAEDAARRDFTINALYADPDGTIHDPLGSGVADLKGERLRFVGDAETRIREDYLRILRLYRFHARLGFVPEADARQAARALCKGMTRLSVERIWQEMRKLLGAPYRIDALEMMAEDGVLAVLLPEAELTSHVSCLPAGDPVLMLAGLLDDEAVALSVAERWKFSQTDARRLTAALGPVPEEVSFAAHRRLAYRIGIEAMRDRLTLDAARQGADIDMAVAGLEDWHPPVFPIAGRDALDMGAAPGPAIGEALRTVEDWWVAEDFRPSRNDCLNALKQAISRTTHSASS